MSEAKRVLVVDPSGNLWGSERAMLDLCEGLRHTPWTAALCCPPNTPLLEPAGDVFDEIYPFMIANLHRKTRLWRGVAIVQIARAIRKFRPDLIYVNQAGATKISLVAAHLGNCPVVSHVRLLEDVDYLAPLTSNPRLQNLICISEFIRAAFRSKLRSENEVKLQMIYDGYKSTRNTPAKTQQANVVAMVGRFVEVKGQDILLESIPHVRKHFPNINFRIVGQSKQNTAFESQLAESVQRLGLSGVVSLEPFASDIWPCLESADFLLCPSRVEPLGRVIFEAWDAGIVPISYRGSGGPGETIAAADAGVLYDEPTPECLADAIVKAYRIPIKERAHMIQRGRDWMAREIESVEYARRVAGVFDASVEGAS